MHRTGVFYVILLAALIAILAVSLPLLANEQEDEEVTVTLSEVPAAVAATIKAQAGSGTIEEIEMETEDGKVEYSAEIEKDGREFEITVAPDGTLLEVEEDDD